MTVPGHAFRFRSAWRHLPAPPERVYAVLERIEDYPRWWPQIHEVTSADADSGAVRLRSLLPLEHRVTLRRDPNDTRDRRGRPAGELAVTMSGDLSGWVRCTVRADGRGGSDVFFRQYTEVTRPFLRLLAPPARPLLRANHAWMMRAGKRGLCDRLRSLDDG